MGLIRQAVIVAILGTMFLGIPAVNSQVSTETPQFKSGASMMMGVPVDFKILNQRVGAIYDVMEHDDTHIVWKFTGTTGDWAFVFLDGRIVVASTVDFDLAAKDTMTKELNDVMDMLNVVSPGLVKDDARNNALEVAIYYASEPEIYHRLKYDFKTALDLKLMVPNCTVKQARLSVTGGECCYEGQAYYIDDQEVSSCGTNVRWCDVSPAEITNRIPWGLHKISSLASINDQHTMILEAITSPTPPKKFVLYGPNYQPWINETAKSMDLQALQKTLAGESVKQSVN